MTTIEPIQLRSPTLINVVTDMPQGKAPLGLNYFVNVDGWPREVEFNLRKALDASLSLDNACAGIRTLTHLANAFPPSRSTLWRRVPTDEESNRLAENDYNYVGTRYNGSGPGIWDRVVVLPYTRIPLDTALCMLEIIRVVNDCAVAAQAGWQGDQAQFTAFTSLVNQALSDAMARSLLLRVDHVHTTNRLTLDVAFPGHAARGHGVVLTREPGFFGVSCTGLFQHVVALHEVLNGGTLHATMASGSVWAL